MTLNKTLQQRETEGNSTRNRETVINYLSAHRWPHIFSRIARQKSLKHECISQRMRHIDIINIKTITGVAKSHLCILFQLLNFDSQVL